MERAWEIISAIGVLVLFFGIIGWLAWRAIRKSSDPSWIILKLIISFIWGVGGFIVVLKAFGSSPGYMPIFILPVAVPLGLWWAPQVGAALASPLTSLFDGGNEEIEAKPFYSIARTQIQRGNFQRALEELRKQLEKFPGDYEGMMLMAELQAEKLDDLPGAELTVGKVLSNPKDTQARKADALHRLADWQLEQAVDPVAAGETLQRISGMFPNSVTAQVALERLAHLPTIEQLLNSKDRKALVLKTGKRNIGVAAPKLEVVRAENFEETAAKLVERLEAFPEDSEAREQLAEVYSTGYKRLDFAEEQLRLLINFPGHTQKQIIRWLNRIADFQIAHGKPEMAKATLKEIMAAYPATAPAEQAENRMMVLERELKANIAPHVMKLGNYKKNVGLSKDS